MKILAVLRASTVKQELDSQKEEMEKFCHSKGFDEIEWIAVKGASARKANKEYLQMLEDIKSTILNSGISTVAFWSLDRLGRIESYIMIMKEWFIQHKVQVYVNNPSLTLLNDDGTQNAGASIAWSVFASIVAFETDELMKKMRRTKTMNAKHNKFNGGLDVKVGYTVNDERYIIVDEEDEGYKLVQLIFNEYSTGNYSTVSLYQELKSRGVTKPNGKPLTARYITKILSDESYIGGKAKDVVTERTYTPIISQEIWDKCNSIKSGNLKGDASKQVKHQHFGIKIIKCPCCGGNFVANTKHYRCWKAFDKGGAEGTCNNRLSVNMSILDGILWRIASMKHIDYLTDLKNSDMAEYHEQLEVVGMKIEEQKRLLTKIPQMKMKIQEGYENGVYSSSEYKTRLSKADENAKTILSIINRLKGQETQIQSLINGVGDADDEIQKFVDTACDVYDETNLTECNKIVHQHIEECLVDKAESNQHIYVRCTNGEEWNFVYYPTKRKGSKIYSVTNDGEEIPFVIDLIEYCDGKVFKEYME